MGSALLVPFGEEIWIADGGDISGALGFHFPTRMAVIRLSDGALLLWSPVALSEPLRADIEALGPVRFLIAPNGLHHSFIADWKRAFPAALIFAAPGLRRKRKDLVIGGELGGDAPPDWAGEIDHAVIAGSRITTEIVFFHRASATVLFTDLLQQMPEGFYAGWRAVVARMDLMIGPEPAVPRKFRVAFTNRRLARAGIEKVLEWPARRVLLAHGSPVTEDARAFLARAFHWLMG